MSKEEKKKTKFSTHLLIFAGVIIGAFLFSLALAGYLQEGRLAFRMEYISTVGFILPFLIIVGGYGFVTFSMFSKKPKETKGPKMETENNIKKYYDSHFLTETELKTLKGFQFAYFEDLKNLKIKKSDRTKADDKIPVGLPVRAEYVKGKLEITMYTVDGHAIIVGASGSGKSTRFAEPAIHILAETGVKPHIIMTDPKGDLYKHTAKKLKSQGYDVKLFDIEDPYASTRWNPLTPIYQTYKRANELENEVKVHHGDNPKDYKLTCVNSTYYSEWYEIDGNAIADKEQLDEYIKGKKQQLQVKCTEDLNEIANVICPTTPNTNDPFWENSARGFILGVMQAMLEDSLDPELEMTEDKFNFYNINQIANATDSDAGGNPYKSISTYFTDRELSAPSRLAANSVVTNRVETQQNQFGTITDKLSIFNDMGLCYALSGNEMDLTHLDEQPTAIFIKIPDQKVARYPIAIMFIDQLYKALRQIAAQKDGCLDRPCYMIMDEFANMPQFPKFKTTISISRSFRIYWWLIVQSYIQLDIAYGQETSKTIKDNCNAHIFLRTNDPETAKQISDRCGTISFKTTTTSVSDQKGGGKDDKGSKSESKSVQLDTKPLISADELPSLQPKGEHLVIFSDRFPAKTKYTPIYAPEVAKYYKTNGETALPLAFPKRLDTEKVLYDIRKVNDIKRKRRNAASGSSNSSSGFGGFGDFSDFNLF